MPTKTTKEQKDDTSATRAAFDQEKRDIAEQFLADSKPTTYLKRYSALVDGVIKQACISAMPHKNKRVSCLAVGGYGRKELFPHSDIDLLFLYEGSLDDTVKVAIDEVLYPLWDLGLQIGHAIRTIDDALTMARGDHTIMTNLLDARHLAGHKPLSNTLLRRYDEELRQQRAASFIQDKLNELTERHEKHGDSRFLLEPNIKENKGALRDLHLVQWLAKYVYGVKSLKELEHRGLLSAREYRELFYAQRFLWMVRIHLHLGAGRTQERLMFDEQKRIGELLGYRTHNAYRPVERFMKRYFQVAKTVGHTIRTLCAAMEMEQASVVPFSFSTLRRRFKSLPGYAVEGRYLRFDESVNIEALPHYMIEIFLVAHENNLSVHPRTLRDITRNLNIIDDDVRSDTKISELFLSVLLHKRAPHVLLRQLNEAGVLGQLIPDFGKLVAQMQYDMYHIYTVDEHIIHTIKVLHQIEQGAYRRELPLTSRVMQDITSRRIVYLAMFTHDIAKGRGGNHTHLGEGIAISLAKRLGYCDAEAHEVGWLVREHQFITEIAFKRDLDDEKVIDDFVSRVQSPERLRKLLAITVADMRSVGPGIWNGWKGELLRTLYHKAQQRMGAEKAPPEQQRLEAFKEALSEQLATWPEVQREYYFSIGTPAFWLSQSYEAHTHTADLLKRLWDNDLRFVYDYQSDEFNAITNVTICLPYTPIMLSHITLAMAMIGASIVNARIFTLSDNVSVVRMGIQTGYNTMFDDTDRLKRLGDYLEQAMQSESNRDMIAAQESGYKKSSDAIEVAPQVVIDNDISQNYSVIEVNARDRVGLLYDITCAFAKLKLTVSTAHISTYGEKAVDVFYVKDAYGLQIRHWTKIEHVRAALTEAISQP